MQKYLSNVADNRGNAISRASILVTDSLGATATIYSDNGVTVAANPIITGADGEYAFYAANGRYTVTISAAGFTGEAETDILLYDALAAFTQLATSVGASLVGFIASGASAVLRALQSKLRETVTPYDFGAIGDSTSHPLSERFGSLAAAQAVYPFATALTQTIDWAACQAFVNYVLISNVNGDWGDGLYAIADTVLVQPGSSRRFSFRGRGTMSTVKMLTDGLPIFDFNVTGIGDLNYCSWNGLTTIGILSTVDPAAVHYRIRGDSSLFQRTNWSGNTALQGYAVFKDEKTPHANAYGTASTLNWNNYTGFRALNQTKHFFWSVSGSGTGNTWNDIHTSTMVANSSHWFFDGANCTVGDIIIGVVHPSCADAVTGSALVKIGANTVYRGQVRIGSVQGDANCNRLIEQDATGSTEYVNWNVSGNNHGGASDLGTTMQPLSLSIVEDRHVARWESGVVIATNSTGAVTTDAFAITLGSFGCAYVELFTSALVGGVQACTSRYVFAIRTNDVASAADLVEAEESNGGQLTWAFTSTGAATGTLSVSCTPSAVGTVLHATLESHFRRFKASRMILN